MELILLIIIIWAFGSLFKGDKSTAHMSARMKQTVNQMKKEIKRSKQLEKKALQKGRTDIAAQLRANYQASERLVYDLEHPGVSAEHLRQQDLERRIAEAERRARDAELEARRRW